MRVAREFINSYGWHILVLVFMAGMAYAALQQKADKSEVYAIKHISDSVHTAITSELRSVGSNMLRNQGTILYLICKDHPKDSACRVKGDSL